MSSSASGTRGSAEVILHGAPGRATPVATADASGARRTNAQAHGSAVWIVTGACAASRHARPPRSASTPAMELTSRSGSAVKTTNVVGFDDDDDDDDAAFAAASTHSANQGPCPLTIGSPSRARGRGASRPIGIGHALPNAAGSRRAHSVLPGIRTSRPNEVDPPAAAPPQPSGNGSGSAGGRPGSCARNTPLQDDGSAASFPLSSSSASTSSASSASIGARLRVHRRRRVTCIPRLPEPCPHFVTQLAPYAHPFASTLTPRSSSQGPSHRQPSGRGTSGKCDVLFAPPSSPKRPVKYSSRLPFGSVQPTNG